EEWPPPAQGNERGNRTRLKDNSNGKHFFARIPLPASGERVGVWGRGAYRESAARRIGAPRRCFRGVVKSLARNWPVYDRPTAATSSGVPAATISPPAAPPS